MAAAARVHRPDQLKPRRVGDVPLGTGDGDATALERLAQRLERGAIELGQFVEKQDSLVGERNLAGARTRSPADERRQ